MQARVTDPAHGYVMSVDEVFPRQPTAESLRLDDYWRERESEIQTRVTAAASAPATAQKRRRGSRGSRP